MKYNQSVDSNNLLVFGGSYTNRKLNTSRKPYDERPRATIKNRSSSCRVFVINKKLKGREVWKKLL